ncbi:hypothetical protein PTKIN_Ptkin15bG0185800 [Pterospermum kingtungense]
MASSSSSSPQLKHEVFLSFRGEDTRYGFTSHLLDALKDRGIGVLFDDEKLEKGEELSPALLKAIAESKISLIVLSKEYASSSWCLKELSEIMEWYRRGQLVVPIFYYVTPSNVRKHKENFEKAFADHQMKNQFEVEKWKTAQVADLKGCHIKGDRPESEIIKEIVQDVIMKLNRKSPISDSKGLVGIDQPKEHIKSLLYIGKQDIRVIGIWGMGGIGKTTLADIVYNEVSALFESCCFLGNVRQESEKGDGIISLRNRFLSEVLKEENFRIVTPRVGSSRFTMDRLHRKRVLVVLDDVSDRDQFESLELNNFDALQLFSLHAFKQNQPADGFRDLTNRYLKYAKGVPIALKVLGSALFQMSGEYWESALNKLKQHPDLKIQSLLKISFEGLDDIEKCIFLDIACFFKGHNKDSVTKILDSCYGGTAHWGISNLVYKCLLNITEMNNLWMHDLLQEMGWEIVHRESEDPRQRSRLWRTKDVLLVLKDDKVAEPVIGISLDISQLPQYIYPAISDEEDSDELQSAEPTSYTGMFFSFINRIFLPVKKQKTSSGAEDSVEPKFCLVALEKMTNLRFIKFYLDPWFAGKIKCDKRILNHKLKFLSNELRYLHWECYPLKSLPSTFSPENLVELRLPHSTIQQLWSRDQNLVNLRVLDLCACKKLREIPNLSRAINLNELLCSGCKNLVELPRMQHLRHLKWLDLSYCSELKHFPEVPRFLSKLNLCHTGVEEVPDSIGDLQQLRELSLICSSVIKISSNLSRLNSLAELDLHGCQITEFPKVPGNLVNLCLCSTQIEEVPSYIGCLDNLRRLDMSNTRIQNLPSSIVRLDALKVIVLSDCPNITTFPNFPEKIEEVYMQRTSIEKVSSLTRLKNLRKLLVEGCQRLEPSEWKRLMGKYGPELTLFGSNLLHQNSLSKQAWSAFKRLVYRPLPSGKNRVELITKSPPLISETNEMARDMKTRKDITWAERISRCDVCALELIFGEQAIREPAISDEEILHMVQLEIVKKDISLKMFRANLYRSRNISFY